MKMKQITAEDPYIWPRRSGVLQAWMLRHYARWLLPQCERRWVRDEEREWAVFRDGLYPKEGEVNPTKDPYQFQRAAGICRMRDLKHFGDYALKALVPQRLPRNVYGEGTDFERYYDGWVQPKAETEPYIWVRSHGLAMVRDLKHLNDHVEHLLRTRREPELDPVYLPLF